MIDFYWLPSYKWKKIKMIRNQISKSIQNRKEKSWLYFHTWVSFNRSPVDPLFERRSLPARSIRFKIPCTCWSVLWPNEEIDCNWCILLFAWKSETEIETGIWNMAQIIIREASIPHLHHISEVWIQNDFLKIVHSSVFFPQIYKEMKRKINKVNVPSNSKEFLTSTSK